MRKSHIRPTPPEMLHTAPFSPAIQQPKSPHSTVSKYLVLVGSLFVLELLGLHQNLRSIKVSVQGIESHVVAPAVESNSSTTIDESDTWSSVEDAGTVPVAETNTVTVPVAETITVTPTIENWPRKDSFYTSSYSENDTSSTIIFNVFKGSPKALEMQLKAAISQQNVVPPQIWVMCFNSPQRDAFYQVVTAFQSNPQVLQAGIKIQWTASDFNHKFHGRFLLAYMATTKYVLIVDDDKNVDDTTVADYIQYMHQQPGVWGNFGHIRAPTFKGYKSWPNVGFPKNKEGIPLEKYAEVDYLSGMWFVQQTWLEYFMKERPPTWETSEDMHLSHVLRKYLNLNTYGGNVALRTEELPRKSYAATVGSALELREYVFDHQLGRGNKVATVDQLIDTLVYVETVDDIQQFILVLESCKGQENVKEWCDIGRTTAVFRGAKEQDVQGLIENAIQLCTLTNCKYLSVKPKIQHYIQYFNMREGFGQHNTNVEIPWQTAASDVLQSFVGILTNVQPRKLFVRDGTHRQWIENKSNCIKKRRLSLYDQTIRLGLQIYVTSPTNPKWKDHEEEAAFPTDFHAYQWSKGQGNMLTVDRIDLNDE